MDNTNNRAVPMTRKEAIDMYKERYGGFPIFLFMGASDEFIIEAVRKSLESGEKIEAEKGRIY